MKAHVILPNNGGKVNGGGKVLIRMAEVLQDLGYGTTLEFSNGPAPRWLNIKVPIKSTREADLIIVCEVSFGWISKIPGFNVVYYQSPTYIERDRNFLPIPYKAQGAQAVIFNSEWNRKRYVAAVKEDGPVVHPTVDSSLFYPSSTTDFGRGIYFPRKNLGMAKRVLKTLKKRGVGIKWLEADEIGEDKLASLWREIGITMITGYPESFPMPPLEAMASGSVPVGTTGSAGHEYMIHGKNSLIVRDGDWESLTDTLEEIRANPSQLKSLRENGIETAKHYNKDNQKKELIKALREVHAPTPF